MKKYFVIGNPIDHSLSPLIHNYWIKQSKINAVYNKKELMEKDLGDIVLKIKLGEVQGINVTVPFKNKIISYLDLLSKEAEITQSVNTIYLINNKVVGHNTDIEGFELAIKKLNFDFLKKKIFILGAGGVVPSIIFALKKFNISEIFLSNRTKNKTQNIKKLFNDIKILDWGEVPEFDVIINATSLGLSKHDKINLDFSKIKKKKLFYDVIYNPAETNFLKKGKALGNLAENGKLMFIYQALSAFNLWHGIRPEIDIETLKLLDK